MAYEPAVGEFQLFVKSINGKTRTITVNPTDIIHVIKEKIRDKEGVAPEEQRLIYAGKNLDDIKTVADYNLTCNSTLHLVLRVRGGNMVEIVGSGERFSLHKGSFRVLLFCYDCPYKTIVYRTEAITVKGCTVLDDDGDNVIGPCGEWVCPCHDSSMHVSLK